MTASCCSTTPSPVDEPNACHSIRELGTPAYLVVPDYLGYALFAASFARSWRGGGVHPGEERRQGAERVPGRRGAGRSAHDPSRAWSRSRRSRRARRILVVTSGSRRTLVVADLVINVTRIPGSWASCSISSASPATTQAADAREAACLADKPGLRMHLEALATTEGCADIMVSQARSSRRARIRCCATSPRRYSDVDLILSRAGGISHLRSRSRSRRTMRDPVKQPTEEARRLQSRARLPGLRRQADRAPASW